jgi:hypothetical protein
MLLAAHVQRDWVLLLPFAPFLYVCHICMARAACTSLVHLHPVFSRCELVELNITASAMVVAYSSQPSSNSRRMMCLLVTAFLTAVPLLGLSILLYMHSHSSSRTVHISCAFLLQL